MASAINYLVALIGLVGLATETYGRNPLSSYEVVFGWKELDYKFPGEDSRERYVQTGQFIPANNILTGIKVWGDRLFLTVPRWRAGVPSTLNFVRVGVNSTDNEEKSPLLEPYPNWAMQEVGNCSALQFVQSMEIDEWGRMWVVDVGRTEIFSPQPKNDCPAKLLIVDLKEDRIVHRYEFPGEVVSRTGNFLNDVVVGCTGGQGRCWAYISDAREGKMVVYSEAEDRSWSVHHKTMLADPQAKEIPVLDGNYTFDVKLDGIALSPKDQQHDRVYFTPLSSFGLYSVPTSSLKSAINGGTLQDSVVTEHSPRSSQCDGMGMDSQGLLFYGLLRNNSVVYVNTSAPANGEKEVLLVENDVDLQWPDTFAFDDQGYLYMVTNRMQRYSTNTLDWSEVNFRVARVFVGSRSYMYSAKDKVSSQVVTDTSSVSSESPSPTNLDPDAPDHPVGVEPKESDLYKHHPESDGGMDQAGNAVGTGDHNGHSHSGGQESQDQSHSQGQGHGQPTSSAPAVNEQLPVVLFLSVLMYNPQLLV